MEVKYSVLEAIQICVLNIYINRMIAWVIEKNIDLYYLRELPHGLCRGCIYNFTSSV